MSTPQHRAAFRAWPSLQIDLHVVGERDASTAEPDRTGMGRMTINKGNFSLLDRRVNSPSCHSVI